MLQHLQLIKLKKQFYKIDYCINVMFIHLFLNKSIPEYYLHDDRNHALR